MKKSGKINVSKQKMEKFKMLSEKLQRKKKAVISGMTAQSK
jgi:hypothetical protein